MKIGIDISQLAHEKTGVGNYLEDLVAKILTIDKENEYILFASSLRRDFQVSLTHFRSKNKKIKVRKFIIPPRLLDLLWNKLHILPIENLIGKVDIFITSDWTEPPTKHSKKATILYDLIIYKHPEETSQDIINTQKRKLAWVKKESDIIFCISEATKKDAIEILGIEEKRLVVIYPGLTI